MAIEHAASAKCGSQAIVPEGPVKVELITVRLTISILKAKPGELRVCESQ
jgi:hypothetical protein